MSLSVFLASCAAVPRTSFTAADEAKATVHGMGPDIRIWADASLADLNKLMPIERIAARETDHRFVYLALSGGGGDGAYGAGILKGWAESGKRPPFDVVSGVSTGALIAPFAFLGPQYDDRLQKLFTDGYAKNLLADIQPLNAIFGAGVFSNQHLRDLVNRNVDGRMLAAVAEEYRKGRVLLVLTTDLDAQRGVIWNMGAIADSGSPQALSLFRKVLVASASIPIVFPPTLIEAEAGGKHFREMHVDGAVTTPIFTLPDAMLLQGAQAARARKGADIYVIMNNKVDPDFKVVPDKTIEIAGRSYASISKFQSRGTLFQTYRFAKANGIGFHLTYIGKDQPEDGATGFDTDYMRHIFQYGREKGRTGSFWQAAPELPNVGKPAPVVATAR
ncbi:patatin-like phospholipase family protein [Faunimonas pinastri]|uniref:patatin-like phospholipase family protein n=1 Tax=Faunimonas pinastri TaxID=1855383 RepID=UPI001EEC12E7|nr:patatin-like phospholipase family protein [Faunimonas pinastri]